MTLRAWGMLLLLSLLSGGTFLFYRILVLELPTLTIVAGRSLLGAVALGIAVLALRRPVRPMLLAWRDMLGLGLLNSLAPFILLASASRHIGAGTVAIFNSTAPVFGVIVMAALGLERFRPARLLPVLLGVAGVAVLAGRVDAAAQGWLAAWADALAVIAAVVAAFGAVVGARPRAMDPLVTALGQNMAAVLMMLPLTLLVDRPWALPGLSAQGWGALGALGIGSTALSTVLFYALLRSSGAANTLLVAFLVPLSAVLLGHFLLGETITGRTLAGMGLIFAALAVIDGRVLRRLRAGGRRQ